MSKELTNITYLFGAGASIGKTKDWLELVKDARSFWGYLGKYNQGIPITNDLEAFRSKIASIISKEGNQWNKRGNPAFWQRVLSTLFESRLKRAFTSQLSPDTFWQDAPYFGKFRKLRRVQKSVSAIC